MSGYVRDIAIAAAAIIGGLLFGGPVIIVIFWGMVWGLQITTDNLPWPKSSWEQKSVGNNGQ